MESFQHHALFSQLISTEEQDICGGYSSPVGFRRYPYRNQSLSPNNSNATLHFDLQAYLFGIGAAYVFGNPGITPEEIQYVWEMALRLR